MGIRIIAGRAKTGKSSYVYEEIKNEMRRKDGKNLILIVPELMTYQAEYEIIESLGDEGIMDIQVLSFKRLSEKVFEEVGGLKVQDINAFGKIMILKQIFEENFDSLEIFRKSSKKEGFLRKFDELVQELKQNSIDINKIDSSGIEDELLKRKLRDIGLICGKYSEATKDRFFDEEDKMDLFISILDKSEFIRNSVIWIDGFESFNGQRYKLIKKLSECCKILSITLNIDASYIGSLESFSDWEAFKTISDTYESLKKYIGEVELIPIGDNRKAAAEITMVEKTMFSLQKEVFNQKTERIKIFSSINPYDETEKTAARIISLVRDLGFRWKDIKVAAGDLESYSSYIKKVFTQYQIPFFLDEKSDIMDNPLTKYILSLLDMFTGNFRHDSVFEYLKTGIAPISSDEVDSIENFALKNGIEGDMWFKQFSRDRDETGYYEGIRVKFAEEFTGKRQSFMKLRTSREITDFIFEYLKRHKAQEKIHRIVALLERDGSYEESIKYAQVWNLSMDIFEQLMLVGENAKIKPEEYKKMLEAGFREIQVSIIPPTIDKVEIGDVGRIAVGKPKALFIMGANEGSIDSKNKDSGLLLDDERELLIMNDINLVNSSTYNAYKDKHMLYKLFSCASEMLSVSYALGTSEGATLQPSLYIDDLKQIFPSVAEEGGIEIEDGLEAVSNAKGAFGRVISNVRRYSEGMEIAGFWKDACAWYGKNDVEKYNIIESGLGYKNTAEQLGRDSIDKIYGDTVSMTVSKLESFAACPFKYFIENIVKPDPRIVQKIESFDLGNIYHRAIEEFTNELNEMLKTMNIESLGEEDILEMAGRHTESSWNEYSEFNSALEANSRNKYMKKKVDRVSKRAACAIVRQLKKGNFRPAFTELEIGMSDGEGGNAKLEPVELKLGGSRTAKLRGRIDRVDTFEKDGKKYVNIIDYKSSNYAKDILLPDAAEGIQTQLFVYMKSILENGESLFGGEKPEIGGLYYFHINDPMVDADAPVSARTEDDVFGKLAMKGYILDDETIIKNMDKKIEKTSDVIPVSYKEDGTYSSKTRKLSREQFDSMIKEVESKSIENTNRILDGDIEIKPYLKDAGGYTPCSYCDYISVCQFDKDSGNEYKRIQAMSDEDVLNKISEKGGDKDGMDEGTKENN